jgi:hypothetical protein
MNSKEVPVGLGTKAGLGTGFALFVAAAVDAVAGEVIDADTRLLIVTATVSTVATIVGRMLQAATARLHR